MSWFFDSGLDLRPPGDRGNAVAALADGALRAAERRVAGVGVNVLPGAVVGRPENVGVLVETERANLVQDTADAGVGLDDGVGILGLGHGFVHEVRMRHVRLVNLHEVDAHEERLAGFGRLVEILERRLLDVVVEERDPDDALLRACSTYWPLTLNSSFGCFAGVAGQRALRHPVEHVAELRVHVGEPRRVAIGVGVEVVETGILHLVVALRVGHRVVGFAEVPLAGEEGLVARPS